MTQFNWLKNSSVAVLSLLALTLSSTTVAAQTTKVEGMIQQRNGDTMILKPAASPEIVVLLNDSTDVGQVQGMLKARKKQMSMAALIPGLRRQGRGHLQRPKSAGSQDSQIQGKRSAAGSSH